MDCQAKANQSGLGNKTKQCIKPDKPQLVQRVKTNAAACGVIDRIGQQMVNIHQHGGHQNKVGELPFLSKPFVSNHFL